MLESLVGPPCPPVPAHSVLVKDKASDHRASFRHRSSMRRGRRVDKLTASYDATVDEVPRAIPELIELIESEVSRLVLGDT